MITGTWLLKSLQCDINVRQLVLGSNTEVQNWNWTSTETVFGFGRNCLWPDCSNDSWLTPSFCSVRNCEPHCYRPQRSCEGYVFTPVCHSVHRGVCLSACWHTTTPGADTPLEQTLARPGTPPGSRHPPEQTPWDQAPPRSRHPPGPGTPRGVDPPGTRHPPPSADGYCCGRYASYWNAF